eukprot:7698731-Alexandrium_andersonii.AAC.1
MANILGLGLNPAQALFQTLLDRRRLGGRGRSTGRGAGARRLRPAPRLGVQRADDRLEVHRAARLLRLGPEEQHALVQDDLGQVEDILAQ